MQERLQGDDAEGQKHATLPGGPVIVTVHGTNDADFADQGHRWWQQGSDFSEHLIYRLAERGVPDAEILPLHWSGQNSDFDRLKGSAELAKLLGKLDRQGRRHAIIAHSHGGNVTVEALTRARRSPNRGGIVTFGTPFFTRRLKLVPRLIALFQTLLGLLVPAIMTWYLIEILPSDSNKKVEAFVFFGGLLLLGLLSLAAGLRKLARHRLSIRHFARTIAPRHWQVVHSPRDEAMQLLEKAAQINPTYVTTQAAKRALTAFASLAGVVATIAFFAWTASYFFEPIVTKIRAGTYGLALGADFTFLLLVPVVYGAVFFVIWLLARLGGAFLYGKLLTSAIHGGVLGAAFGGDGPFKLVGVTRLPPYLVAAREERIEATDLGGIDEAALFTAAQSLYNCVVANEEAEGGIADPDTMWKRLSDALYHNAYMRDDGVVTTVADHLVAVWSERDCARG
jgi:hypothetical protein